MIIVESTKPQTKQKKRRFYKTDQQKNGAVDSTIKAGQKNKIKFFQKTLDKWKILCYYIITIKHGESHRRKRK